LNKIADTPEPPYYTVIFSSVRSGEDDGYDQMAKKMLALATGQAGLQKSNETTAFIKMFKRHVLQ